MVGEEMINLTRLGDFHADMTVDAHILKRSTAYAVDDKVNKGLIYLKCTQAGTTASTALSLSGVSVGDTLTDGTAKWKVISIKGVPEGGGTGAGLEDWESNHNYAVDDIYVYEGEIYKTLVKFTSGATEDSRTKVNDIVPSVWTANTAYTAGDIIEHTDVTTSKKVYYNVTDDFTSGATFEVTEEIQELQIVEEYVPQELTEVQEQEIINHFLPNVIGGGAISVVFASAPAFYQRQQIFSTNKTTITIYPTWININNRGYVLEGTKIIDLTNADNWDDNQYITAANRAGKDFYIYACEPTSNDAPDFVLSANSTVPTGYTADNSRKIGGFHCLCLSVGIISGHTLSGYLTGDILPQSPWDLKHRAISENEGMVYVPEVGKWVDIYLASYDSSKLVSTYGGIIIDGESTPKMHGEQFVEYLGLVKKQLPSRDDFMVFAKGSNEGTNILGSVDPNTTGGHVDTDNRRMISNYGIEDCCGVMWQWTNDTAENYATASNTHAYWDSTNTPYLFSGYAWQTNPVYNPDCDTQSYGSCFGLLRRLLVGGYWGNSAACGSRALYADAFGSRLSAHVASRGCSTPRV